MFNGMAGSCIALGRTAAAVLVLLTICGPIATFADPPNHPTSANCTEKWFTQNIDHFNWAPPLGNSEKTTFQQRYFVYDAYWNAGNKTTIFWYHGNEDDVTLYVNHTGLMWELAPQFGALLVFSEHRYYGQSKPFAPNTTGCMSWLTSEQAMADTATLMRYVKQDYDAQDSAIISFGGSYGGMLVAWFARKYPELHDGGIAASAPIWTFLGMDPPYDDQRFAEIITRDASKTGGSTNACRDNYAKAQPRIAELAKTEDGQKLLQSAFHWCTPITSQEDAMEIIDWTQNAFSYMAMGNYPYPSSYILHGRGNLPAYPVRASCQYLSDPNLYQDDSKLMNALRQAMDAYYNYTQNVPCFSAANDDSSSIKLGAHPRQLFRRKTPLNGPTACTGDWGYQYCTEIVQPFSQGLGKDMFWPPAPFNLNETIKGCQETWGVTPRANWATLNLASKDLSSVTNLVFSNGDLDPWTAGGVLKSVSSTVRAIQMPNGAHHIDLMFSDERDPPDVVAVRAFEADQIKSWISQKTGK